jgi:DNA invertase Pin-like site-specific DNA recombinase
MTIYAYLRISTDKQDVDNQRHGLLEYANSHAEDFPFSICMVYETDSRSVVSKHMWMWSS